LNESLLHRLTYWQKSAINFQLTAQKISFFEWIPIIGIIQKYTISTPLPGWPGSGAHTEAAGRLGRGS
jgi:hypothetical protein